MKKIITAINNPILNKKLSCEENIKVIGKDIQYKEAILDILEKEENINLLIISENLPGEIDTIELIKKINKYDIDIIFILEKQNDELEENLKREKVNLIYYNNKVTIDDIINVAKQGNIINENEIKKEIEILKEIVLKKESKNMKNIVYIKFKTITEKVLKKLKKYHKKTDKKRQKIITFCGNNCVGKSSIIAVLSKIYIENFRKILVINFDEKNFQKKVTKNEDLNTKVKTRNQSYNGQDLIKNNSIDKAKFEKVIQNYDLIYIDNSLQDKKNIEEEILKLSNKIILIAEGNIINISESKKILERYINNYLIDEEKINILFNKYNKYSIEEKILEKIFFNFNIIGKIKSNNKYNYLINTNYKIIPKKIKKENKKILNKIIY